MKFNLQSLVPVITSKNFSISTTTFYMSLSDLSLDQSLKMYQFGLLYSRDSPISNSCWKIKEKVRRSSSRLTWSINVGRITLKFSKGQLFVIVALDFSQSQRLAFSMWFARSVTSQSADNAIIIATLTNSSTSSIFSRSIVFLNRKYYQSYMSTLILLNLCLPLPSLWIRSSSRRSSNFTWRLRKTRMRR